MMESPAAAPGAFVELMSEFSEFAPELLDHPSIVDVASNSRHPGYKSLMGLLCTSGGARVLARWAFGDVRVDSDPIGEDGIPVEVWRCFQAVEILKLGKLPLIKHFYNNPRQFDNLVLSVLDAPPPLAKHAGENVSRVITTMIRKNRAKLLNALIALREPQRRAKDDPPIKPIPSRLGLHMATSPRLSQVVWDLLANEGSAGESVVSDAEDWLHRGSFVESLLSPEEVLRTTRLGVEDRSDDGDGSFNGIAAISFAREYVERAPWNSVVVLNDILSPGTLRSLVHFALGGDEPSQWSVSFTSASPSNGTIEASMGLIADACTWLTKYMVKNGGLSRKGVRGKEEVRDGGEPSLLGSLCHSVCPALVFALGHIVSSYLLVDGGLFGLHRFQVLRVLDAVLGLCEGTDEALVVEEYLLSAGSMRIVLDVYLGVPPSGNIVQGVLSSIVARVLSGKVVRGGSASASRHSYTSLGIALLEDGRLIDQVMNRLRQARETPVPHRHAGVGHSIKVANELSKLGKSTLHASLVGSIKERPDWAAFESDCLRMLNDEAKKTTTTLDQHVLMIMAVMKFKKGLTRHLELHKEAKKGIHADSTEKVETIMDKLDGI